MENKEELESMQKTLLELMVRIDALENLCLEKKVFTADEHGVVVKNQLRKFAEVLAKKFDKPELLDKIEISNPIKE